MTSIEQLSQAIKLLEQQIADERRLREEERRLMLEEIAQERKKRESLESQMEDLARSMANLKNRHREKKIIATGRAAEARMMVRFPFLRYVLPYIASIWLNKRAMYTVDILKCKAMIVFSIVLILVVLAFVFPGQIPAISIIAAPLMAFALSSMQTARFEAVVEETMSILDGSIQASLEKLKRKWAIR